MSELDEMAAELLAARVEERDKRIAELEVRIRQYERWCEDAEPRRDALAELVSEVVNGHYDMRSEFVAAPDWLARARAALGEGQ